MKMLPAILVAALAVTSLQAAPKKVLVVTTTTGFRHSSIPTSENVLAELAKQSGDFTVEFIHQPEGKPADLRRNASDDEKAAFKTADAQWREKLRLALEKLSPESLKNYDAVAFVSTTGDTAAAGPGWFSELDQVRRRVHRHSCRERHLSWLARVHSDAGRRI